MACDRGLAKQSLYQGREQRLLCYSSCSLSFLWEHGARNTVDWATVDLGNVPNFRISDREGRAERAKGLDDRWRVFEGRRPQGMGSV